MSSVPSPGSSPIVNSYVSNFEYGSKTNGDDAKFSDENIATGNSPGGGNSDEGELYLSGGEEFETASGTPFSADPNEEILEKAAGGEVSRDLFIGSLDNSMPKVVMPIAKVSTDDDDDDDVEPGDKVRDSLEGDGFVEGIGSNLTVRNGYDDLTEAPVLKVGEENKVLVEKTSSDAKEEGTEGEKLVGNTELSEVEERKLKGEDVTEEDKKIEVLSGEISDIISDVIQVNAVAEVSGVEEVNSKEIEADGVKVTAEGDSIVEALDVELPGPGVAIVEKTEENKEADRSVGLTRGHVVVESEVQTDNADKESPDIVEEEVKSEIVEADGVNFTAEGDSIVEAMHVDLSAPGVVIVDKVEQKDGADGSFLLSNGSDEVVPKTIAADADFKERSEALTNNSINITEQEPVEPKSSLAVSGKDESTDKQALVTNSMVENVGESTEVYTSDEGSETPDLVQDGNEGEIKIEHEADDEVKENGGVKTGSDAVVVSVRDSIAADRDAVQAVDCISESTLNDTVNKAKHIGSDYARVSTQNNGLEGGVSAEPSAVVNPLRILEPEDEVKNKTDEDAEDEGSVLDEETDGMIFGSSEAAKQFIEELERGSGGGSHSGADSFHDHSQRIDGQIVTDSDEEVDTDEEGDGKELFDSAALAALLKAATGAGSDGGNITISSQDGSRLFTVERPAGLGSPLQSLRPAPRPNRSNFFSSSSLMSGGDSDANLSEEEKKKLEKLQSVRVKFLRLIQRLGLSPDESVAAQVLYRLSVIAGRQTGQLFSNDAAKMSARQLEAEGKEDLEFSVSVLVLGKSGVGKSATINSIFGEEKALIDAFEPATTTVKEISGTVGGVKIRVFDTPGLKSSVMEQAFNRSVLSSVKKFTKKTPPDIVLYVDRLDAQTRDLNDLPMLKTVTSYLGPSIWRSAIVTLTHAASAPPDGPNGSPLSYEVFVTQRSHVVQQSIGQAVGDLRMVSPSLMNPVSLVENHPSCRKNREGQKVLPNGQSWRPHLLLLCYSMKILSEASALSKPQDPYDHRKLFGFRVRSPPLLYMLSSMLQSRAHPKLSSEQGGDNGDSDIDLEDLSDSDREEDEDEYDQLPPFKPLRKSQLAKLSKEQRNAYYDEYDYRVKLLQKKQWKEELKRMREMKKGKDTPTDYGYPEEDTDPGSAAPVAVPLPDMALPPSFDSDNPAYRYRFLEPTSQFLARPVLDTHGWDHDCGYDGVNLEQSLAIASQFPAVVSVQITKDKKEFNINLDSSVSAKLGENGSSMAGFDIQTIGKQLAYIIRGETKFKNFKKNKTAGGISVTFLGENVATGFKIEDQIVLGKQYVLVGSAGTVRSQNDAAYGANLELKRRENDYPIGQVQSSFGLQIVKWRGELALGFNSLAQFSIGRNSKVAVRAGINNKLSGQISVRTSSSEHLSLALAAIIPTAVSIYKKIWPDVSEKYSIY
ncbi:hypothetical protein RJ639_014592 [Escallonia herrerae]|uniref:AIG1-type G domain-containing protein n=1 Tax=Escallonia herrerae TaxID=1293975 RepID=A0AA88VIN5_9ASTE|nr:hypothetical protein RJ639_014592 [Escallonia herrerae]